MDSYAVGVAMVAVVAITVVVFILLDYFLVHVARDYIRAAEEIIGSPDFTELIHVDGTDFKVRRIPTNLTHVYNHRQSSVSENTSGQYRNTEG